MWNKNGVCRTNNSLVIGVFKSALKRAKTDDKITDTNQLKKMQIFLRFNSPAPVNCFWDNAHVLRRNQQWLIRMAFFGTLIEQIFHFVSFPMTRDFVYPNIGKCTSFLIPLHP